MNQIAKSENLLCNLIFLWIFFENPNQKFEVKFR